MSEGWSDGAADVELYSSYLCAVLTRDTQVHGVTGSNIGAFMIIPGTGYEGSSGGPFFRDINNQGATQQELYFCGSCSLQLIPLLWV